MPATTSNHLLAAAVLRFCAQHGVRELVLCAGARNAPLVELIEQLPAQQFLRLSFFEERSAAFFALGRIVAQGAPVAVLTTSGTAAAELLPATIEAYYQGRPLLLITADRPARFRGSGSPQSMDQFEIYGPHVEKCVDIADANDPVLTTLTWSKLRPLHLNVCFEEPQSQKLSIEDRRTLAMQIAVPTAVTVSPSPMAARGVRSFASPQDIHGVEHPLLLIGPVPFEFRESVRLLLRKLPGPIYAESLSGLTGDAEFADRVIFSEDVAVAAVKGTASTGSSGFCDSVIRIGTVPTCRLWRDLEVNLSSVPVVNLVPPTATWSGLARESNVWTLPLNHGFEISAGRVGFSAKQQALLALSQSAHHEFKKLVADFPRSEVALLDQLSKKAADPKHPLRVYVGNSLPVREWDWISKGRTYADIFGHRGVNGIDGQVSSFLGWSGSAPSLAVIGDLTAMYDLAALALTPQLHGGRKTIAVVNNGGGMIFHKIFGNELFLNRHDFSFSSWATMFGWGYQSAARAEDLRLAESAEHLILEIRPDAGESAAFQKHWQDFLQRELKTSELNTSERDR